MISLPLLGNTYALTCSALICFSELACSHTPIHPSAHQYPSLYRSIRMRKHVLPNHSVGVQFPSRKNLQETQYLKGCRINVLTQTCYAYCTELTLCIASDKKFCAIIDKYISMKQPDHAACVPVLFSHKSMMCKPKNIIQNPLAAEMNLHFYCNNFVKSSIYWHLHGEFKSNRAQNYRTLMRVKTSFISLYNLPPHKCTYPMISVRRGCHQGKRFT